MQIFVDADAFPKDLKEILFKAAERKKVKVTLVAEQRIRIPDSELFSSIAVPGGQDAADHKIVELMEKGDLVITADIPLADRAVQKGGYALNPRGEFYTEANIKNKLAMRNLMQDLRSEGMELGGPPPFNSKARQDFANKLDSFITRHTKTLK